jgi:hypothetical protein
MRNMEYGKPTPITITLTRDLGCGWCIVHTLLDLSSELVLN